MELQPGIGVRARLMRYVDRRKQSENLNHENNRRGERAHERKPICRTNQHVDEDDRPGEKGEDFEEIGDRTAPDLMTAHREKRRLKNKTKCDGKEIETAEPEIARAERQQGTDDRDEETRSRDD